MPLYAWDVSVPPAEAQDVGRLVFERGASIVGFVTREDERAVGAGCRAQLLTADDARIHRNAQPFLGTALRGTQPVEVSAAVNAHGFFQIRGVPPGEYRVRGKDRGTTTLPVEVVAKPGEETRLAGPLLLGQALGLDVTVAPQRAPSGEPWTVMVMRAEGSRQRAVLAENVGVDGSLRLEVSEGDYFLTVRADGQQWFGEYIHVAPDSGPLQIELPLVHVTGKVRMGGQPLNALVTLRHPEGRAAIVFQTDASGVFRGDLPAAGKWDAEVQFGDPVASRVLRGLEILPSALTGIADLTITLPATWLRVKVVTEDGAPVPTAFVRVQSLEDQREPTSDGTTDQEGLFEVRGLASGQVALTAQSEGWQSDHVNAALVDGAEAATDVRLVARRTGTLTGHVSGEGGRPVAGATVWANATGPGSWRVGSGRSQTDVDGRFELPLPAGAQGASLVVAASGYALKLVPIRIPAPPGLVVALGRSSGRLVIEADEPWEPGRPHLAIGHAGARELLIGLIAFWARPNKATWDARRIAVPAIEPGEYEVCATSISGGTMSAPQDETCSRGALTADGELVLRLPRPH